MKPKHLIYIILGLAVGHWGYLEALRIKPQFELWAAHRLVVEDLKTSKELDQSKSLLLCLKQLEDYEIRMRNIIDEASLASLSTSDLGKSSK